MTDTAAIIDQLHRRIKEMQEAAYTYGDYSKDAVSIALDGVLETIDELTATQGKCRNNLHMAIMNIPIEQSKCPTAGVNSMIAYKAGHRDARHAAAELATTNH